MAQVNIWLVVTLSLLNQWSLPPIMKESGNYTGVWGVCMLFLWHYLSRCVTFYKVEKVIIILFVLGENSVHFSQYNYKILFPVRTFMCCKAVCRTGKLMHVIRFAPERQNLKSALNWILNLKIIFFFMPAKEFLRKMWCEDKDVEIPIFFNEPSKRYAKGKKLFVPNNFPDIVLIHWRTAVKWKCSFLHYLSIIFSVLSAQMIKCYSHLYSHLQSRSKWLWKVS